MPKEKIFALNDPQEIISALRKDKTIVGVWTILDSDENHNFFYRIVYQNEGKNDAMQILIPRDGGEATISEGAIIYGRRKNVGNPTRVTIFESTSGERITISEREF